MPAAKGTTHMALQDAVCISQTAPTCASAQRFARQALAPLDAVIEEGERRGVMPLIERSSPKRLATDVNDMGFGGCLVDGTIDLGKWSA
jgi:hypothetical protein